MPFGDTAKKLKQVSQMGEKLYARLNELFEQVQDLRNRVENTSEQISTMDRELAEQRAIVEALAEQQGIDVDEVVAEATSETEGEGEGEAAESDASKGESAESESIAGESAQNGTTESEADAAEAADEAPETTEVPVTESGASGGSDGAESENRE